MSAAPRLLLLLTLAVALVATSCASDGRELAEARDWQTTTTRPPPPTSAPPQEISTSGLTLSSPDFEPGETAPAGVRCDGDNKFPDLEITGVPSNTAELAVTLSDQTNPEEPLLLWLMGGIPSNQGLLESGFLPNGGYETLNDYGQLGWGNPCLETFASGMRDLQFRVYVLESPVFLESGAAGNEAWDIITAAAIDSATLLMRIDATGT